MKSTLLLLMVCVALALTACGRVPDTPTGAPAEPTTGGDTAVPVAPTDSPPAGGESTPLPATAPPEPPTEAPAETATAEPTVASRPRPTATPASSGPLDFQTYIAGCTRAPTADKPGNVVITISVEATGGNGVYRYFHKNVEEPDKFIDVEWQLGTGLNGKVTVVSGDGQTLEKEYFFQTTNLECSA